MFFLASSLGCNRRNGHALLGLCLHLFLPYNPKAMYISPLAFKVIMSVSSKWIPYPRVLGFFLNSDPIPHHDVGRQDGQIHLLKGVDMQNANYNQRLTKERPEKNNCFAILSWRRNAKYSIIMLLRECCKILGRVVFNSYHIPSADTLLLFNSIGFNISRTKWVF